jgi:hypothetical protein
VITSTIDMDLQAHPILLSLHPNFAQALNEFKLFLDAAETDLDGKADRLREQKKQLQESPTSRKRRSSTTARKYVECQLFMLSKHRSRMGLFRRETEESLAQISRQIGAADEVDSAASPSNTAGLSNDSRQSIFQLQSDLSKMKRRCKHMLDVTDRYCVLDDSDLKLDELQLDPLSRPLSQNNSIPSTSGSDDSVDGSISSADEAASVMSCPTNLFPTSGALPPNQMTKHMVRSTFESFGSHLRVIAKTYTRKRGRAGEEEE